MFKEQIYNVFQFSPPKVQADSLTATTSMDHLDVISKLMPYPIRSLVQKDEPARALL